MRVEFRGLDGGGNTILFGNISLIDGRLEVDSSVVREVLDEKLLVGGRRITSDTQEVFLRALPLVYRSAYFRAVLVEENE